MSADPTTVRPFAPTTTLAIVLTVVGWASSFAAVRAGLEIFGPAELGALRFTIAAVPAALLLALARRPVPTLAESWRFAFGGVIFIALYTVLLNFGQRTVPSGEASFIVNANPIITAVLATWLLGERLPASGWLGTMIAFVGVGLIALSAGGSLHFGIGALMIVGAACCTSVSTIVQKPLFERHEPLMVAAWNILIGALFLCPALPNGIRQMRTATDGALFAAAYLGIVPSFIAYGAWATVLARLPAARASNFLYCVPPVATLIGILWLGEVPSPLSIIGGAAVLGGVAVVNVRRT